MINHVPDNCRCKSSHCDRYKNNIITTIKSMIDLIQRDFHEIPHTLRGMPMFTKHILNNQIDHHGKKQISKLEDFKNIYHQKRSPGPIGKFGTETLTILTIIGDSTWAPRNVQVSVTIWSRLV